MRRKLILVTTIDGETENTPEFLQGKEKEKEIEIEIEMRGVQ